jgi:hypothetical protein
VFRHRYKTNELRCYTTNNSPVGIAIRRLQDKCTTVGTTQASEDGETDIVHITESVLVENGAVDDAPGLGGGCCTDHDVEGLANERSF